MIGSPLFDRAAANQIREVDFRNFDDGVGTAEDVQFPQDIRNMNLNRGLANLEFVRDLLVLQSLAQHIEHAQLLGRKIVKTF